MTTTYPAEVTPTTPVRRGWLKRLGALLGGTLLAGPTLARAARRSPKQIQGSQPFLGEIMLVAIPYTPKNFVPCEGQLLSIAQNPALFSLLSTTYGGDGRTTFALPDLRGRAPRGQGTNGGSYLMGQSSGSSTATLTTATLPAHNHSASVSSAAATASAPNGAVPAVPAGTNLNGEAVAVLAYDSPITPAGTTSNTGSGTSFSTQSPFLALRYCISITGVYPARP